VDKTRFFVVRHAEAQKNIEKMHGGGTQDLTERGIDQLKRSIRDLEVVTRKQKAHVFYQKEGRSEETAKIISRQIGAEMTMAEQIYGVGLGVIASLNEDELKIQYPEVSRILENWKNNGAKLDDYPDVPGREHMMDFARRIKEGLLRILKPDTDIIIVGTTSTINMLNHLMSTNGEFVRDKYNFVLFPFSGINGWRLYKDKPPEKIFSNF
ncbi:histidine phosphatase family protein, partial [Candidatus Saccharibacteria bacterium]|nr:histidine phosphatase family protein [Candidatus Saccharibacteria bacterium]